MAKPLLDVSGVTIQYKTPQHLVTATYKVSFGGAPTGDYKFYCLPHLALGMHGKITVQ